MTSLPTPPSLVAVIRTAYWTLDHSARAVPLGNQSYAAYQQANAGAEPTPGWRRRLFHGDRDDILPRIRRVKQRCRRVLHPQLLSPGVRAGSAPGSMPAHPAMAA
jgi:hypothetical protein